MVMVDVEKGGGVLICVAGVEVGKKVQDEQSSGILSSKLEISSTAGGRDLYVILRVVGSLRGRSITAMRPTDVSTVVVIVSLSAREERVIWAVALDRLEVRMRSELAWSLRNACGMLPFTGPLVDTRNVPSVEFVVHPPAQDALCCVVSAASHKKGV